MEQNASKKENAEKASLSAALTPPMSSLVLNSASPRLGATGSPSSRTPTTASSLRTVPRLAVMPAQTVSQVSEIHPWVLLILFTKFVTELFNYAFNNPCFIARKKIHA